MTEFGEQLEVGYEPYSDNRYVNRAVELHLSLLAAAPGSDDEKRIFDEGYLSLLTSLTPEEFAIFDSLVPTEPTEEDLPHVEYDPYKPGAHSTDEPTEPWQEQNWRDRGESYRRRLK